MEKGTTLNETYSEILEEAENVRIDAIASTMDIMGVTPSIGRLYGIMYFSELPMTLEDMSKKTGMSKPRMSTSVRSLLEIQHIHKVWRKGERKDLYEAEKDFFKTFISFYCKNWEREYIVNRESIEQSIEKLEILLNNSDTPLEIREKAERNKELLEESKHYFDFLEKLVHTLRSKEFFTMLNES